MALATDHDAPAPTPAQFSNILGQYVGQYEKLYYEMDKTIKLMKHDCFKKHVDDLAVIE
jgi:hypothetical protein